VRDPLPAAAGSHLPPHQPTARPSARRRDANGELRVWDLLDARPVTIRRLHSASAGIIGVRLFAAGRRLATQGRDGVVHLWAVGDGLLCISEEPERTFARESFSFCRFSLLDPAAAPA
jgi:WD40 repeat protein